MMVYEDISRIFMNYIVGKYFFQVKVGEINDQGWVAYESSHFGTFSGKLFVAPNTIDFANVFGT